MISIDIANLEHLSQRYYYKGVPFTGIGFRSDGKTINHLTEFREGVLIGKYTSLYLPDETTVPHVSVDYIDFPGQYLDYPAIYKNKKFTGVIYEFEDDEDIALIRYLFEEGHQIRSVVGYPSGEIGGVYLSGNEIFQSFSWFKHGSIESCTFGDIYNGGQLFHIELIEENCLKELWIEKKYFDWIIGHEHDLEFHYFKHQSSLTDIKVGAVVALFSEGVDETVFNFLSANDGLKGLAKITLSRTSLNDSTIVGLANIETLEEIELREINRDLSDIAKQIKRRRPDCLVTLNGKIIESG